jgi:hypothetical protein
LILTVKILDIMATNENLIPIPGRLHSVATEGHVAGAGEIYDDDLQMNQAEINAIVLGGAITTTLSVSPSVAYVGTAVSINLTASSSVTADTITIKKGDTVIATGTNKTSQAATDSLTPVEGNNAYSAQFVIGGLTKNSSKNVVGVYPIYYGAGAAYTAATTKASARTTPAGTYNVTVASNGQYVWFVVPATMTINKATKGGFDFPLEAPQSVTVEGVAYKAYRSSNTYDAGTEVITLS